MTESGTPILVAAGLVVGFLAYYLVTRWLHRRK
jgi:membrane-associated phospholipid phosphatase